MKTTKAPFAGVYHHINAPTISDEDFFAKNRKRKLIVPTRWDNKPRDKSKYDAYRALPLAYLSNADWAYKRKLDGENQRVFWDGEQARWNGKSDNYTCSTEWEEYMNSTFIEEIFEEKFSREAKVFLFGERMGKKVQTNELGLDHAEFVLFDVVVNGVFLGQDAINEIAHAFGIHSCFDFMQGGDMMYVDTLEKLIERCADGEFKDWEGIVATPQVELFDGYGTRIITKIKTCDYYVEAK
ncbi:MAG: RNA ligase family protein [Acetobacter sp.]|nr:RNA ligase family protein [Acetobacter sp.]